MNPTERNIDLSIIINIHRELKYLARTFRSLNEACYHALGNGISIELVAVLDNTDDATRTAIQNWIACLPINTQIVEISKSNLADARNSGISACHGNYISLHDADDLISHNYLTEKYKTCQQNDKFIAIPEYLFLFGNSAGITHYKEVSPHQIINYHPYISQIMGHRDLFRAIPYENPNKAIQRAYEDWKFNTDAISNGYIFKIAKNTILFYRQHQDSIMSKLRREGVAFYTNPSTLFTPIKLIALKRNLKHEPSSETKEEAIYRLFSEPNNMAAIDAAIRIEPQISIDSASSAPPYFNWQTHSETTSNVLFEAARIACKNGDNYFPWAHIFIIHDLSEGGGEKYLIQVAEAAYKNDGSRSLFLTLGTSPRNAWGSQVEAFADLLNVESNCSTQYEKDNLTHLVSAALLRIVEGSYPPPLLHIKPSKEAFEIQDILINKLDAKCFVNYRWCDEPLSSFHHKTWNPFNLKTIERHLSRVAAVICDNRAIKERDKRYIGTALPMWHVVRAHVDPTNSPPPNNNRVKKLLWAGRFAPQKRPSLLAAILKTLSKEISDIHIDVYTPEYDSSEVTKTLPSTNNFTIKPAFSPSRPIPAFGYDALVYTSHFDGLPNVILECLALGIPVIAPGIDGIPEAVIHDKTGLIVEHMESDELAAQLYCNAIQQLYTPNTLNRLRECALKFVEGNHSRQQHTQSLLKIGIIGKSND